MKILKRKCIDYSIQQFMAKITNKRARSLYIPEKNEDLDMENKQK